ncbi:MAG TPA: HAD family hydrolase [Planktothrix sp.]|jgi:HAD superfamily hydrolase (TIGR01509 family)
MKAVIFDIDGTLIDSVDLHAKAWKEAFDHFGVETSFQKVRDQIGKGGDHLLPTFISKEQIEEFGDELKEWRGEHFKSKYMHSIRPFKDSHALLDRVKKGGLKVAAGSSAKQDELDYYIGLLGAKELFDVTTSADDVERSKPSPDVFAVALKKLNSSFDETVVIGDSPYDAEAAAKIGLTTIGFLSGGFPEDWLRDAGAAEIYDGPTGLLKSYGKSVLDQ